METHERGALSVRLALLVVGLAASAVHAADGASPATFSAAQAIRGSTAYGQYCAACHGTTMNNGVFGPPLLGSAFLNRWGGRPVSELLGYVQRTMPPGRTSELNGATYTDLIARLLEINGAAAGQGDLPDDPSALSALRLPGQAVSEQQARRRTGLGSVTAGVPLPAWPQRPNPLDQYTPVTEALLSAPPAEDWLTWRRSRDGLGFSPLRQITKENVGNLQIAWSLSLPLGMNEIEPLVHDGVMFVFSHGDHVQAFDAATGDELWHYARELPNNVVPMVKRSMAIYAGKLFIGTSDAHLLALDVKTGHVAWDQPLSSATGFTVTGGPLVAKGKVLQGLQGRAPGGNQIVAVDAETGKEAWRFHTVAQPGSVGGNSWNGLPVEKLQGGSIWTSGTYDPQLNLVFFGPGNTYDTGPLRYPVKKRGVSNDALFTSSTIALDPDTGALKWHYQHVRNDQWDYDWAYERQIVPLTLNGSDRKLVVTAGKLGLFDALDAATGRYAFSVDMGLQTLISAIDPKTGEKQIDPALLPDRHHNVTLCPHGGGGRNWMPTSYNPETKILYAAAQEICMDLTPAAEGERGFLSTGVNVTMRPRPGSDGRYGRLQAIDLQNRKTVWTARQRAFQSGGVLSTAGGVVFAAATDRFLTAYDDASGKRLWRARLSDIPNAPPVSFSTHGRQYVAVVVSSGASAPSVMTVMTPEIPVPLASSTSIWVFALPEPSSMLAE